MAGCKSSTEGTTTATHAAITEMLATYYDLNSAEIDELYEQPSALEFMRYVARNRPFVIRGGCEHWTASRKWTSQYLVNMLGEGPVNVAVTPHGNADAVVEQEDGTLLFVEPLEQQEPFRDVLRYIQAQDHHHPLGPIKYAQTQNDNLRDEYRAIFDDVPRDISFARIALQKEPDAINFWLGNAHSVTAMHKDNYENVYAQIRGRKSFVLLPPVAAPCVNEQSLPAATYVWATDVTGKPVESLRSDSLKPSLKQPPASVPCPTWDPDQPGIRANSLSSCALAMKVTLNEGDMLYLPAQWFHIVSQECGDENFCCAVNYWYDMDFGGQFWATNSFIRDMSNSLA